MDFGNPKKLKILTTCVLFRVLKRLEKEEGGWHIVTDFVTRLMRPKYLLKKSDRKCTLTQLVNKKYDSVTFSIRITFEQVSKQRLKIKNSIKRLLNAIFWLYFEQRTSRYRLSLSSFCSKQLTSNRCISGLPCPIVMHLLSSESTFPALFNSSKKSSNQNNA